MQVLTADFWVTEMKSNYADGFRKIPNALYEAMMKANITRSGYKILFAVIHLSIGYQKNSAEISLTQFSSLTGLSRQGVIEAIKFLISQNVITKLSEGSTNKSAAVYSVNQNFDTWTSKPELTSTNTQKLTSTSQKVDQSPRQKLTSTSQPIESDITFPKEIKENLKNIYKEKEQKYKPVLNNYQDTIPQSVIAVSDKQVTTVHGFQTVGNILNTSNLIKVLKEQ